MGSKFGCPVCGHPTEKINQHPVGGDLFKCPNCGSTLEAKGRVWHVILRAEGW